MSKKKKEKKSNLPDWVDVGVDSAGSAIGAIIGGSMGGPPGAIFGSAAVPVISHSLKKVGSEIKDRFISNREDKRIASAIYFAAIRIDEKIKKGEKVRNDDFFDSSDDSRSSSDEVLEGALIASQREHEEKKIEFIGYLIANICFDNKIDKAHANLLIRIAENLSYRQFQILSLLLRLDEFGIKWPDIQTKAEDMTKNMKFTPTDITYETKALQRMELLEDLAVIGETFYHLRHIKLTNLGKTFCRLAEIESIPSDELQELSNLLNE